MSLALALIVAVWVVFVAGAFQLRLWQLIVPMYAKPGTRYHHFMLRWSWIATGAVTILGSQSAGISPWLTAGFVAVVTAAGVWYQRFRIVDQSSRLQQREPLPEVPFCSAGACLRFARDCRYGAAIPLQPRSVGQVPVARTIA